MGSAIPRRDVSVTWVNHLTCGARHPATAECPTLGTWLVAGTPATYLPSCTCPPSATIEHRQGCPRRSAIERGMRWQLGYDDRDTE